MTTPSDIDSRRAKLDAKAALLLDRVHLTEKTLDAAKALFDRLGNDLRNGRSLSALPVCQAAEEMMTAHREHNAATAAIVAFVKCPTVD